MFSEQMKEDLVTGLREILGSSLQRIILYGSVARHEETEESDIDVAIVLEDKFTKEQWTRFIEWASELDLKYERVFSIIDIEKEKLEKWKNVLPFYKNVCEEGIVLWKVA